jgi:hypothetical protein
MVLMGCCWFVCQQLMQAVELMQALLLLTRCQVALADLAMHVLCHTLDTSALTCPMLHRQRLLLHCWQQRPPQAMLLLLPLQPHSVQLCRCCQHLLHCCSVLPLLLPTLLGLRLGLLHQLPCSCCCHLLLRLH